MPRFTFQLDGVLRHRDRIEKDRQRELGLAIGEMARLQTELNALSEQVRTATIDVQANHLTGRLDMNYLAAHRRYMLAMQRKVTAVAQKMAQQQLAVDTARHRLGEASKEKKIMEKLRDLHRERWAAALALKEAREVDELTTQLSYRQLVERIQETS